MILQEKRSIKTGKDAVDLLQSGKLAGQLGGKKFIPSWIVEDPKTFEDLVNLTLDILGKDANIASDEVIQLLIKYSFTFFYSANSLMMSINSLLFALVFIPRGL